MDPQSEVAFQLRVVDSFPEPEFTALQAAAFADFGVPSELLTEVLADESVRDPKASGREFLFPEQFRVGAFVQDRMVGWSYSRGEGNEVRMVNSGIYPEFRRKGIYSAMVRETISWAEERNFRRVFSRHVPGSNAVLIPKLRLGFLVSAFEYSEVYGPLVHLSYVIGTKRRELYRSRSAPIVAKS